MVIDARWITYLPFIAVGAALLAILFRMGLRVLLGYRIARYRYNPDVSRRYNPIDHLIFSIVFVGVFGLDCFIAGNDLFYFRSDPACMAGFSGATTPSKLCRIVPARIVDHAIYSRQHRTDHNLDLDLGNGSTQEVTLVQFSPAFWSDIESGDTLATVQLYRGKAVAVQTNAGTSSTGLHPAFTTSDFARNGIFFGLFGLVAALFVALRGSWSRKLGNFAEPPASYPRGPFT